MSNESERESIMRRMKSSQNVSSILQGDVKQGSHYIDELDRFSRNFASHDKIQREEHRKRQLDVLEKRRRQTIQKEQHHNQEENRNAQKYFDDIDRSQKLHEVRLKKTAHTNGLPVNPITNQYDRSLSGSQLRHMDNQNRVKHLVRAHNLITRGTSGYNLINGTALPPISYLVPEDMQNRFKQKLVQHYQNFRIKATSVLDHAN